MADVQRVLQILSASATVLEEIARIGRGILLSPRSSDEVVGVLAAIVATAERVITGMHDPSDVNVQAVHDALTELRGTLASNDAAVVSAIDQKFPR